MEPKVTKERKRDGTKKSVKAENRPKAPLKTRKARCSRSESLDTDWDAWDTGENAEEEWPEEWSE